MTKLVSRLSLKKELYCVQLDNFKVVSKSEMDQQKAINIAPDKWPLTYNSLCLECKRGKYKKNFFSQTGQSPFAIIPGIQTGSEAETTNSIIFDDQFLQVSQFYISTKKNTVQRKIFEVKLRGYDDSGKPFQLGGIEMDLSKYVDKAKEAINIPFTAK